MCDYLERLGKNPPANYPPPIPGTSNKKPCKLNDFYNYGKIFLEACNKANITEEQGLMFLKIFSEFNKEN